MAPAKRKIISNYMKTYYHKYLRKRKVPHSHVDFAFNVDYNHNMSFIQSKYFYQSPSHSSKKLSVLFSAFLPRPPSSAPLRAVLLRRAAVVISAILTLAAGVVVRHYTSVTYTS